MKDKEKIRTTTLREAKIAVEQDQAETIRLRCAGMSGHARHTKEIPGPVLMGLRTSEFLALLWKQFGISRCKIDRYESLPTDGFNPILKRFSKPSPAVKKMAQLIHHTKH